jgi:hypothetical protein
MARLSATNYTTQPFTYATAATDLFKKEDVQVLAQAVDTHDHSTGKGLNITPAAGSIPVSALPDGSITSAKIADGTIDTIDLKDGSVTTAKILDGTIATVDLANAAVTNAKLGADVSRTNLLTNGGFEVWQRGVGPFTGSSTWTADRWLTSLQGTDTFSITRTNVLPDIGSAWHAQVAYTKGTGSTVLFQQAKEMAFKGLPLTFSIRVATNVAGCVRAGISTDGGTSYTFSAPSTAGGGSYGTLTVSAAANPSSTFVSVGLFFSITDTVYVDNAMLVVGSQAADFVPMHAADDLARCQRYYEVIGESAGEVARQWYGIAGSADDLFITYKQRKPVAPTVTRNGTWNLANCSQPSIYTSGLTGVSVRSLVTATGMASYTNSTAGNNITVESNP